MNKAAKEPEQRLRIEYMALSLLKEHEGNAKLHDLEELDGSVESFGFNDPIAINETTKTILEGHGRREYLAKRKEEGRQPPKGVVIDVKTMEWLVPVLRGVAFDTDEEAEAYLTAHNEIGKRAGYDNTRLVAIFDRLQRKKIDPTTLGFSRKDIEKRIRSTVTVAPRVDYQQQEEQFLILVDCKNEQAQAELLERLTAEGVECKAMMS